MAAKPLLAFFGATGGSTLACLVPALKDSYDCLALVRSPDKLTSLLLKKGVPQTAIDSHLHLITGDALTVADVEKTLTLDGRPVDIIISGIGIRVSLGSKEEVTICRKAVANILTAIRNLKPEKKPLFVALSSTGVARGEEKNDLPLLMKPIYSWGLKAPHADKIAMENVIREEAQKGADSCISGYILPRPSMLTDGAAKGTAKVKEGTEDKPAVGYTISRDDVGIWMYEKLVKADAAPWIGKKPSLTY